MTNKEIIETIIVKINEGYDNYDLEKFLEQQEINLSEFDVLIETANNQILEQKLKAYPKQNKQVFIFSLILFIVLFLFFTIILPVLLVSNGMRISLSILGSIALSLSGFYTLLYYKSWNNDFIEKVGKPKFDLQTFFILFSLPTVLFYFLISWCFVNGSGYDLYKLGISIKAIKSLIH